METVKVDSLNEVINDKNKIIETLQNKTKSKEIKVKSNERRCRYWNRGFCKKGDECRFYHPEADCGIIFTSGKCEDKKDIENTADISQPKKDVSEKIHANIDMNQVEARK